MPVRSLHSSPLRWPDRESVLSALRAWVAQEVPGHPQLVTLVLFGSYARGDNGVGSDVDLLAVVKASGEPFEARALHWNMLPLPVPAEILVYTAEEWEAMRKEGRRFFRTVEREGLLLYPLPGA
jgi:uncharacterized protein